MGVFFSSGPQKEVEGAAGTNAFIMGTCRYRRSPNCRERLRSFGPTKDQTTSESKAHEMSRGRRECFGLSNERAIPGNGGCSEETELVYQHEKHGPDVSHSTNSHLNNPKQLLSQCPQKTFPLDLFVSCDTLTNSHRFENRRNLMIFAYASISMDMPM